MTTKLAPTTTASYTESTTKKPSTASMEKKRTNDLAAATKPPPPPPPALQVGCEILNSSFMNPSNPQQQQRSPHSQRTQQRDSPLQLNNGNTNNPFRAPLRLAEFELVPKEHIASIGQSISSDVSTSSTGGGNALLLSPRGAAAAPYPATIAEITINPNRYDEAADEFTTTQQNKQHASPLLFQIQDDDEEMEFA